MAEATEGQPPLFLTTKEVAGLLRVKERKVYDLAAEGAIPHRRITGKLLFPSAELMAWIEGSSGASPAERPAVVTGSHDPLLDWAIRESECGLATLFNGSLDGLDCFEQGKASICALHIRDGGNGSGWNIGTLKSRNLTGCVLIAWASRSRGLILAENVRSDVKQVADLKGKRVAMRQPGAGARALFDDMLEESGLMPSDIVVSGQYARTESDAAASVAAGEADAAIGIEAMARHYHLGFVPLVVECFDLLIDRRSHFTAPVQRLLAFSRLPDLQKKAADLGGYDLSDLGAVRWLSA